MSRNFWAAWNQEGGIEDRVDGALPGRLNAVTIGAVRAFELFKTRCGRAWETTTEGRPPEPRQTVAANIPPNTRALRSRLVTR